MDSILQFALLAFTSLFTMVNPLGVITVFTSLTSSMNSKQAASIALKPTSTAQIVLLLFTFGGNFIFDFFNISINGLRVGGGILFFLSGFDMLRGKLTRIKSEGEESIEAVKDFAITPLGVPMITGPGVITISIVMMNDAPDITHKSLLIAAIFIVMGLTHFILLSSRQIINFLGESGNKVLTRIMGLIVMVIAVELFFRGLKPIIQGILQSNH
ncbi:MarC family protein [Ignavibacterium sp.]|uniref:MarC family protein n=1 Tax=Ignavibacterium sp. TaxID=2651167 RepID=UPI00307F9D5F